MNPDPATSKIPANILSLHAGEETLYARSLQMVEGHADLLDHLDLTERAMDVMDLLRQHYQADEDEKAITYLAIRTFNGFATAWKLMASGYYQNATLILRDVLETTNLVNAFHVDRALIAAWRNADRRTLKRDFSPAAVRKILDNAAGQGKSRREDIYIMFSTLAGHPTLAGIAMLRPKGMDAHMGPFSDLSALRAVMEEMGKLAAQSGLALVLYLDTDRPAANAAAHHFLRGVMDYSGNYVGKTYTAEERAEIDRLFSA
jgi:hypothetical protein